MHSVLNIVVAAALILPFPIAGQDAPSATQSTTATPSPAVQQPPSAVNGKASSSPTGRAQRKRQKMGANTSAAGSTATKPGPAQAASVSSGSEAPKKIVVRQGGVREPSAQIVTGMDPAEATRKQEDSQRLLREADESLKRLVGRALTEQQQETVSLIDHYMTVARSALKEGDISRGHTLALKANLLAADIAKH